MIITRDDCTLETGFDHLMGLDFAPCGRASLYAMAKLEDFDAYVSINDEIDHVVVAVTPSIVIPKVDGCHDEFRHFIMRPTDFDGSVDDDRFADLFMHEPTGELAIVRTAEKDASAIEATILQIMGFLQEVGERGLLSYLRHRIDAEKLEAQFAPLPKELEDLPFD